MSRAHCKVSDEQVSEIRSRYSEGSIGIVALAAAYGISKSMVSLIIRGEARPAPGVERAPPRPEKVARDCARCGKAFRAHPSEIARGGALFCSADCYHADKSRSEAERFWEKVNKDGPPHPYSPELGPCWLWTAGTKGGKWPYGALGGSRPGEGKPAHRVSWELHHGPVPEGMNVLHSCDVPACVNPAHLWLGTQADNMHDMIRKGRQRFFGRPPKHK